MNIEKYFMSFLRRFIGFFLRFNDHVLAPGRIPRHFASKSLNMKRTLLISLVVAMLGFGKGGFAQARTDNPWQIDLSAGLQSFYAPVQNLRWERPELVTMAGIGKPLGPKQHFEVGLQVGYARNNYQGDALFLQIMGKYTPLVAGKIEAGIGIGVGYRIGLYPSDALKWNGSDWISRKSFKGMLQVPLQVSLGYRSIELDRY